MVPDPFISLMPPKAARPKVPGVKSQEIIPVPASAVPRFGAPAHLVPDNFWDNLKQFLTERPIKLVERPGARFTRNSFGGGICENLKEFLSSRPVPKGPINSRLAVRWGAGFGSFGDRIKELFFPAKLPPIRVTSKPIKVRDIWSKDENFGWTQAISVALHASLIALLVVPIFTHWFQPSIQAKNTVDITPIDLSTYVSKLPSPNMPNFGDPRASANSDSLGHGSGTGIGSGSGGGLGPGETGGTGGGAFRAGINGVGVPVCIYCPTPQYSDEARKAKYQGTVVLQITVTLDGRAVNISVVKSPGLGLEE